MGGASGHSSPPVGGASGHEILSPPVGGVSGHETTIESGALGSFSMFFTMRW